MENLGLAQGLWFVAAAGDITTITAWKRNAGASSLVDKHKTAVSNALPPGAQSNITPPGIMIDGKHLYFFPDCILVRQANHYAAVNYGDLRLDTRPSRFIVEDTVPSDCETVGQTWKHPNKSGGPDRRFANNRPLPICLFEELALISTSGLKALLLTSARQSAIHLATALSAMGEITGETSAPDQILITHHS